MNLSADRLLLTVCEGCDGTGIRAPATPLCQFCGIDQARWTIVERCDMCERFEDDAVAARQLFATVRWVQCVDGGWHAIGRYLRQ